jgi:hypothetical protein
MEKANNFHARQQEQKVQLSPLVCVLLLSHKAQMSHQLLLVGVVVALLLEVVLASFDASSCDGCRKALRD